MKSNVQPVDLPPQDPLPPEPPAAPRPITPQVSRRAWMEHSVRKWWVMGALLLLITAYHAASRWMTWKGEKRLIENGALVDAEVMSWEQNLDLPPNKVVPLNASADIVYYYNGQKYREFGPLEGRNQTTYTRKKIPIHIDRDNPRIWTARLAPEPLRNRLLGALLLSPGVVVLLAVAVIRRQGVLRLWRDGQAMLGHAMEVRHAAAAPFSRLVSCAVEDDAQNRVVKVIVPAEKAPHVGQVLWLIAPPGAPERAIPATLFE